jgi:hypothetical protein
MEMTRSFYFPPLIRRPWNMVYRTRQAFRQVCLFAER